MSESELGKVGQPSEPGEYDEGMQTLLQIIWGDGFLSPGGSDELARLLEGSDIAGCAVLDVGCGLGAIDELLVEQYGASSVVGIDVDPSLLAGMRERIGRSKLGGRIRRVLVQGGPLPFEDATFDVVFSKDSLVQIPDKPAIFAEVLRVLRPAGRFIASDWLRGGSESYSAEMLEFFRLEGIAYNMATLAQSARALHDAGFVNVEIRDRHDWYLELAPARRGAQARRTSTRTLEGCEIRFGLKGIIFPSTSRRSAPRPVSKAVAPDASKRRYRH